MSPWQRLRAHPSISGALLAFAIAAGCGPELKTLSPADGAITSASAVSITGTYAGVPEANAVVTVNGAPATLGSGSSFSFSATGLAPGANAFLVTLGDVTKPNVRVRQRIVVIRGDSIAASEEAPSAAGLRLNESFVDALPKSALVEAALASFVAENEFFQDGIGADLITGLIDSADSLEAEITAEDGLRLTMYPAITAEGEHEFDLPFPLGSATCGVTITIGGSVGVRGNLALDGEDDATLAFSGQAEPDFDAGFDIYDPTGIGPCDAMGVDVLSGWVTPLLDLVADVILPGLADDLAHVVRLAAEVHQCAGDCPPAAPIDLGITGSFETVDERDGGVVAEAALRAEPLTTTGVRSFAVDAPLPTLGATSTLGDRPYDVGLSIAPTALNQLLMAITAEGALDFALPTPLVETLMGVLGGSFFDLTGRITAGVAPFLDGQLVCPSGLAAPRLVLPNARLEVRGAATAGGAKRVVLTVAIDLVAGVRLRPMRDGGALALGPDLVVGSACGETSLTGTVLHNATPAADAFVEGVVGAFPNLGFADALSLPALPLEELFALEDGAGADLASLGLQPVEVSNDGAAFQVFANLLVDGLGGDPDVVILDELFYTESDHGALIGLEKIGHSLYLGFGEYGSAVSSIYRLELAAPQSGLQLVTDQVFAAPGFARGIASDGTDLYAIGVGGDFFESDREVRRITTGGAVSLVTAWPWDNQFASSIYAEGSQVYYQRAWNPNVVEWNDTQGRAIWRVGTDGANPERWVGQQHGYLEITADIGRAGTDFLGAGSWYSEGEAWSYWYRFADERELGSEDVVMLASANDFTARELTTACGGYVLVAGEREGGGGALWASGMYEDSGVELATAYPALPAPFGGIARDGDYIYVAAGNPGEGVQVYQLYWPCGG